MSKLNCFKVDSKKIEIESDKRKKKETAHDSSSKMKNARQIKAKSSDKNSKNSITDPSKTFAIYEKRKMIEPLRKELIKRGWTEIMMEGTSELPKFVWLSRSNGVAVDGSPIINRVKQNPTKNFCYKDVLLNYNRNRKDNKNKLNMPRTFNLFAKETDAFMNDYRLTAYSSFIRFLHASGSDVFSATGKIKSDWINFAIEKLEVAIVSDNCKQNDNNVNSSTKKQLQTEFGKFKKIYQSVVKYNSKIKATGTARKDLLEQCRATYEKCKEAWKDFEKDGFYNLWLLKPARRSLGVGIKLFDDDDDIFSYARDYSNMKYLVQKYVERPMLIYSTKFDLRQYFLIVHHKTKVCLWMYKMCYLKFSTKLYDPLNFKVSVHITNTAVQSKYSIDKNRSTNIPQCNEWSSDRFLQYLKAEKKLSLWYKKIYPAMKKTIIETVSAATDLSMIQPNHFQLYGSDFVIDENHDPFLLEINGCPILTSVICSMCLQDLVKVVIDTKENLSADTGHFEKVWEKKL